MIKKAKITVWWTYWTYIIGNINSGKIIGTSYKKEL